MKNLKVSLQIISIPLLLSGVLFLAVFLRVQSLGVLQGKYFFGTDSYRFVHQAKHIVEGGSLPERDKMRWVPIGRDLSRQLSLSSYAIAWLFKLFNRLNSSISIEQVAIYYPIICFALGLIVFFALVQSLLDRYTAFIATSFLAVFPQPLFFPSVRDLDYPALW